MPSIFDIPAKGQGAQTNMLGIPSPYWEDAVNFTLKHEGGLNPIDTNGTPSMRGINQAAHPDIDVTQLSEQDARDIYRKDYWEPIGGDALASQNPQLAKVAFDTAVMAGPGKAKELLDQAGGDPNKFMDLREQFLTGLLQSNPAKYGKYEKAWTSRNANLRGGGTLSQSREPLDMGSLVSQYGIDPYPAKESKPLSIPQIPSISPDTSELYKVVDESPLGRGFSQALSGPPPQVGKLPFGVENKGGRISQITKDVLYGLPEGVMNLAAGLVGMPAAAIGGTAKAMTSGLAAGGDTFNEIASTAMGHPQTATAQLMMKPFEVIFGGILNSGAEVVKDLNPNATPQELDNKVKATQFVMNLVMVAPMFKGAVKGRGKVDVENPAKSLDTHEVTPEAVEVAKTQVLADPAVAPEVKAQVEGVDVGVLQSIQKKAATSVAKERAQARGIPEVKFPENRSIVEGLLTEVELREGRAKTTMRKAAQIVADYDGDIALADLNGIKGINVKGSTGKAIARLIEERDATKPRSTGDDVPLDMGETMGPIKSLEEIPAKVEPSSEISTIDSPTPTADPIPEMVASVDPSIKYDGKMGGIPEAGIPDIHNLTLTLEDGRQPSFSISGEITPEKVAEGVKKVREKFEGKVEEPPTESTVVEASPAVELPTISEFDSIVMAKDEGYTFPDKDRYQSPEKAQAKAAELGEGHEVLKVGKTYKVAKYVEEVSYPEFKSEAEANAAGFDILSEIPDHRVKYYQPEEGGTSPVKIGDKYYRTIEFKEMPDKVVPEELTEMVKEKWEDDVSPEDWSALKAFTDEATFNEVRAQDKLKELVEVAKAEEVKTPESNAALAKAFLEWRESYVTRCNVGKSTQKSKPITKESLAIVDDNFKTFDSIEAANEWMEATGAVGELIPDPLTGKVSFMNTEKLKGLDELDLYDEGIEQLTGRSERGLEDWDNPNIELSDTGTRDLFDIFNNERGSVDVTPLRVAADAIIDTMEKAKKMGKSVDEYLARIGADEVAIAAFKGAMAQLPNIQQQIREKDPTTSSILMPSGKIVAQTVIRNRNKEITSVGPPITEELAARVMNANREFQWGTDLIRKDPETGKVRVEHTSNAFEKAMQATEVKINSFRAAGLSDIYSMWREAKSAAEREKIEIKKWLDNLESQISPERREAFAIAAYADMKSVKEAFDAMGITEIPQLTPKETAVLEQLLDYTRKFRDRSNYIRTHTGQKAIPQLKDMKGRENYLPLMRDINVLRDMGLAEGLTISDSKKLGELSKKFNGMFNPNSKKRNVSDIPIELDPFRALRRHAEYGIDEIHISPVAALAKDLANLKLPRVDGVKGKMSLVDWNPNLSRMLSRWSDQIVGKDIVATAMANANPFFAWAKDRIAKNLVVATIGGSLRTVLVQPTSYIIGIPTMTDLRSTAYGIGRLMAERPFGRSNARQHSSVLNIREADYNFKELSEYIQQGKMSGGMAWMAEKSLAPMKWVDSIMAEAGWNAARYYGERKLKLQGKELYRYADDIVERTQGLGIKGAVSDIQSSAATKWLTLLQTFAIADFNLIARDVLGIKNPEANQGKTIIRVAKYTAATILAGQLYKMIGLDNVVPDPIGAYEEAKKEGKGDLKAIGSAAGELLEKVPLIGGSAKYGSNLLGIAGEWADILPEAGEKFSASLDWGKLSDKQKSYNIRVIARAVGLTMGIPMTNQILKSINSAYKGGDPWEVILGVYEKEKKKKGGLRPNIPRPPQPPKLF